MWEELKTILRDASDKAVVVEDGKPRYIVLSIEEYTRLRDAAEQGAEEANEVLSEAVNDQLSSIEIDESAKEEAAEAIDLNNLPL
ncbi:MAG: hypothetical protein WDZ44_02070 [Candidatus Spechtbacterales bacterium]